MKRFRHEKLFSVGVCGRATPSRSQLIRISAKAIYSKLDGHAKQKSRVAIAAAISMPIRSDDDPRMVVMMMRNVPITESPSVCVGASLLRRKDKRSISRATIYSEPNAIHQQSVHERNIFNKIKSLVNHSYLS